MKNRISIVGLLFLLFACTSNNNSNDSEGNLGSDNAETIEELSELLFLAIKTNNRSDLDPLIPNTEEYVKIIKSWDLGSEQKTEQALANAERAMAGIQKTINYNFDNVQRQGVEMYRLVWEQTSMGHVDYDISMYNTLERAGVNVIVNTPTGPGAIIRFEAIKMGSGWMLGGKITVDHLKS